MEYSLWNIPGGFWPGTNSGSAQPESIPRNVYNPVNDLETNVFQPSAGGDGIAAFTTVAGSLSCQPNARIQTDFIPLKDNLTVTGSVSVSMPGHHDDHSHTVVQHMIPLVSDMMSEQSAVESLASTESPLPSLIDPQNRNNNEENPVVRCKEENLKVTASGNDEEWTDAAQDGTNVIKSETNPGQDYLFQQNYAPQSIYGMVYPGTSGSRREAGTSDETDDDDNETEETFAVQQSRATDDLGGQDAGFQSRSPSVTLSQETAPFQRNGYECGECGLVAETRPSLKKHISMSHPAPDPDPRLTSALLKKITTTAKCPMASCRFRTSDKDEMETHVSRHVAGEAKIPAKKRASTVAPQRVRYEREEYRCQICAYSCTVEKAFYKHLKVHSVGRQVNQVKISCVICGKDRSSEVDMNKHMKKHRDDRFFCCDICIFKTVQLKKLIQHRRMHTGEKPHLCPHCSYRSARRDNLRSHVRRVHKKENLFCDTFSPRGLMLTANANPSGRGEMSPTRSTTAPIQPSVDSQRIDLNRQAEEV